MKARCPSRRRIVAGHQRFPQKTSTEVASGGTGAASRAVPPGCTITGTARAETLGGTPGRDVICGLGGKDILLGRGGDDRLLGGDGDDILDGGTGADALYGGAGDDYVTGTLGHDRFSGGTGADHLHARDGSVDTVDGGPGIDRARIDRTLDRLTGVERT